MSDLETYRAINSMSLPLLDQDGKPRDKECLVRGGENVQMLPELAERALAAGTIRELTEQERAELTPAEPQEGSEANGDPNDPPTALVRPAANAKKEEVAAYARAKGLDDTGTRDEINARIDAAEKLESQ